MSRRIWRALTAIVLGTLVLTLSPRWAVAQEADVDAFVEAQISARRIPGASIAVVKDGAVVLMRGYGLANVEHQVPATAHTMYQLASVTKQFTATGA